jgi:hypothetical protein
MELVSYLVTPLEGNELYIFSARDKVASSLSNLQLYRSGAGVDESVRLEVPTLLEATKPKCSLAARTTRHVLSVTQSIRG